MNILFLTLPIAFFLSGGFIAAFIWATLSGQWDDLDLTPQANILEIQNKKETHEQPTSGNHSVRQ